MNKLAAFLSQVTPFQGLPPAEMERLLSVLREVRHARGETVFSEGDPADSVWILETGRLEIFKYTSEGRARAIEVINPKDLFGTLCRLGASGRTYPCTAVAATESVSVRMPDAVFLEMFHRFPSVLTGVCTLCSNRLVQMQDLACSSQEPVEKRIVKVLVQLSDRHGNVLPYTKREISELAGTTVETTIRTLSEIQKKKWISSSRGEIVLEDKEKLQAFL